jgi:hypothetical protein
MVTRVDFQNLAADIINNTFGDFRDDVVLTQLGTFDYDTQTTTGDIVNNTKGIRTEFNKSQIDGQKIQVGDFKILVLQQSITVDVRADNTSMTFNGIPVSIEFVAEDSAQAIYTIQAREK